MHGVAILLMSYEDFYWYYEEQPCCADGAHRQRYLLIATK